MMASTEQTTAAREAIRIADKYLPKGSIEQRKALALEIVDAISLCEREMCDVILSLTTAQRH